MCIVMDYADGGDLHDLIEKQKHSVKSPFEESRVLTWFAEICLALQHIHAHKVLHRDLKTQNVFLTAKGEVKVGDFGIARVMQDTSDLAQTAIGTPYYLSPEMCDKRPYNSKSDIWSLGCILYEMLTFRRPFDAPNISQLVISILSGKYAPVASHWSPEVRSLLGQMLQLDPEKRPSAAQILALPFIKRRAVAVLSQQGPSANCSPRKKVVHLKVSRSPQETLEPPKVETRKRVA